MHVTHFNGSNEPEVLSLMDVGGTTVVIAVVYPGQMTSLSDARATVVRTTPIGLGRCPTSPLRPEWTSESV